LVARIAYVQPIVLSRRQVLGAALLVVLALALGARFLLSGGSSEQPRPPTLVRAESSSARTAAERVVVYVVGAVRRPGLYRLREGARVADAVSRAGGLNDEADRAGVNLAAPVADGQQVVVPARLPPAAAAGGAPAPSSAAPSGPVQLSVASVEQLDALPGIGPVTAQKIVDYRAAHGAFRSVEALDDIPGIGPARVEQLRGLVVP
jgi:competence protein ComEA